MQAARTISLALSGGLNCSRGISTAAHDVVGAKTTRRG
jgi:hypothetical protein